MFRNKLLVTTHLASPTSFVFFLLRLSLSDSSSPIEIETLCWKFSRRFRLACFHSSPSSIFVIYQRCQSESAALVVEEINKTLAVISVADEEEVSSESANLLAMAVECWFRSLMLEKSWRCIGDRIFVDSTFAVDEEKNYLQALNVRVQSEKGGILVFLVSPDAIWFTRHKISDLVASRTLETFHDGNAASVVKDSLFTACTVLPCLYNGHIIELSKLPPVGEKFELLEKLCLIKHGLTLSSDYCVNVHFSFGDQAKNQWLPSAFVLRGSGLSPAPQTVRSLMALNALNSFIRTIECSDFFNRGLLKVKEVSSLEAPIMHPVSKLVGTTCDDNKSISSSTQKYATDQRITTQNVHLMLDFRTPKPALCYISANRMLDHEKSPAATVLTREEITETTTTCSVTSIPKLLNEVVEVAVKSLQHHHSQAYQRESGQRDDIITIVKPGSFAFKARKESILQPRNMNSLQCSSKDANEELMSDTLNHNSSSKVQKAKKNNASSNRTSDKEIKVLGKESKSEPCMKKTKQHTDSTDVISKVCDFHARGKLQSLTISDLKCFLASKKVKVGGKKEELIQRVTVILG